MSTPINEFFSQKITPICIYSNEKVNNALEKMKENDFSQLPVINENNEPIGLVSFESIVKAISNFGIPVENLTVQNSMENIKPLHNEAEIEEILDQVKANGVAILTNSGIISRIITSSDLTDFFRLRAEDWMYMEDIEDSIKELIKAYFTNNDVLNKKNLQAAVDDITSSNKEMTKKFKKGLLSYLSRNNFSKVIDEDSFSKSLKEIVPKVEKKDFENLTQNDYLEILLHKDRKIFYNNIFDMEGIHVKKYLTEIKDLRNNLAHFTKKLSNYQREEIKRCAEWLSRCQEKIIPTTKAFHITLTGFKTPDVNEEISTSKDGKYFPLGAWLLHQPGAEDRITLTFKAIEKIIGSELPPSAYNHRAWWANDSVGHIQSILWLDSGWRVSYRNLTTKKITFVRIRNRERRYIDFFANVLANITPFGEYKVKEVSPDGSSWIELIQLPISGPRNAVIGISFALNNRFRIELNINTGDQEKTKAIFDKLVNNKTFLEEKMSIPISWERLDGKNTSRIAIYTSGNIRDSKGKLQKLTKWISKNLAIFSDAFIDITEKAIENIEKS